MIEMICAIVIIGFLAGLAIPRLTTTVEKSRLGEAINILETLRGAQELYKQENGAYTGSASDLDITIPTPRNFSDPTVADADPIASIQRNAGGYNYTLKINIDGTIKCAGVSPANICAKIGCGGGASSDQCN